MATVEEGAAQLEALGRRLKAAGGGAMDLGAARSLKNELLRGIRNSNKGTIKKIRDAARSELPHSGGLADRVAASSIGTRTRLSGQQAGVTITGTNKNIKNLRKIDEGALRHPVFARAENRKHWAWASQSVRPGWFSKSIEADLPHIRTEIEKAMSDVTRKIEGH